MSLPVFGALSRRWLLALCALPVLSACNPTFNWRELRPEGSPLQALMPCKPDSATRPVPLDGGAAVALRMYSCDTGGLTFAVAWAEMGDEARVSDSLKGWRRASLAAVRIDPARADDLATQWNTDVPGATLALGLTAQGHDHQGRAVQVRAVHFARGSQVFQAAVYGPKLGDEVTAPFFDGLKLP